MARRFQKKVQSASLIATDGEIAGPDVSIVVGSKWAGYVPDLLTEIEPDDTIAEESENAAVNGLGVEVFTPAAKPAITGESLGTGNGVLTTFTDTAASLPVERGSVKVYVNAVQRATDDGKGNITGSGVTGTINYATGALSVTFSVAPTNTHPLVWDYEGVSKLTLSGTPVTTAAAKLKVYKNDVAMVEGTGPGQYRVSGPKEITLGTGANGTDKYLVAYLTAA